MSAIDIDALADALAERLVDLKPATPALVDTETAAAVISVPPSWLLTQARRGHVPHRRIGKYVRWDVEELRAWADRDARFGPGGAS